jgi:hypothetical protein
VSDARPSADAALAVVVRGLTQPQFVFMAVMAPAALVFATRRFRASLR